MGFRLMGARRTSGGASRAASRGGGRARRGGGGIPAGGGRASRPTKKTPPRSPPPCPAGARLKGRQTREHVLTPGGVAHGPDPPDLALERAEGRPDLDAEVVKQALPDSEFVHALRDQDRRDHGEAVAGRRRAEQREPQGGDALPQGIAVQ